MKNVGFVVAVFLAALGGAFARDVIGAAHAQTPPPTPPPSAPPSAPPPPPSANVPPKPGAMLVGTRNYQYRVVGASMNLDGYQQDLDSYSRQGWRYVGTIRDAMIFER